MKSRHRTKTPRQVAMIAAIILLLGQTMAAAHFHSVSPQREVSASAAGIADSTCAICAAQLHSSAAPAVAPALDAPAIHENLVAQTVPNGPSSIYIGNCFGRAPPASL